MNETPATAVTPPAARRRWWRRRLWIFAAAAVLAIGLDAFLVVTLKGLADEAAALTIEARESGARVAEVLTVLAEGQAVQDEVSPKVSAAQDRVAELTNETDATNELVRTVEDAVLALDACLTERATYGDSLWTHSASSLAASERATDERCAAALATYASVDLVGGR